MRESERRLAAIMFTDMVGYASLAQSDETLALKVLESQYRLLRPIFPLYHGREVKTIGDSFLVEFDSALNATNCAIDIQQRLHEYNRSSKEEWKVRIRIGVHLGDVLFVRGDLLGDAVNIASRIEPLAEAGGICVSEQVFDQVRNKVSHPLFKLAPIRLKNIQWPVDVYKIVMPWDEERATPSTQIDKRRVAVLPFANMSPDASDEYFTDGMTEELISTMSRIRDLRVVARTSVMGYKGTQKKISEIARELEVGAVLEGSVRKAGDRLRITVQLIDALTSNHLWAESFDRELKDVFAIQSDIAQRVAESLKVGLLSSEKESIKRRPTDNPEAFTIYLQGRYQFRKFTREGLERSLEFYRKAAEADPRFALAYGGMAYTYAWFGFLNLLPEKEAYPKAREFAETALELDDSLADCHYILGRILLEYYWAFSTGEAEIRRSIALNPNDATVHLAYSWLLASRLESTQAITEAEKAVQLDPKSAEAWWSGSYTFYLLSQFGHGIEYGLKSIELNPLDPLSHLWTALNYVFAGESDEAIKEMREATALSINHVYFKSNLGFIYGFAGKQQEAREILHELIEAAKTEHVAPMLFAWVYAGLRDVDNYFAWLQKAYEARSSYLVYIKNDPYTVVAEFRSDPRFNALMQKIGLEA